MKGPYDETGPATEDADIFFHVFPSEIFKAQQVQVTKRHNEHDKETIRGLERVGFCLDKAPSDSGSFIKYFQ